MYENVIVLDACYMNKCPTIMCLAKKKKKNGGEREREKEKTQSSLINKL